MRALAKSLVPFLAVSLSLAACAQRSGDDQKSKPAEPTVQPAPQEEPKTAQTTPAPAPTPPAVPAPAPTIPTVTAPPQDSADDLRTRPVGPISADAAVVPAPSSHSKDMPWLQRLEDGAIDWKDRTVGFGERVGVASKDLVTSDDKRENRQDTLSSLQEQQEHREKTAAQLASALADTSPLVPGQVNAAVTPNDEGSTLLASILTEPNIQRVSDMTSNLVDEIFSEPQLARAKVMKIQLNLRRAAEDGIYNQDAARRIAYLQAVLDDRVRRDESADLLRDSLFIAGTSMALGAVAGFHGFDRAGRELREFSFPSAWRSTRNGVEKLYNGAKSGMATIARLPGKAEGLFRTRLTNAQIASRNLRALDLTENQVRDVSLEGVDRNLVPFIDWQDTNLPQFKYLVVDTWNGVHLGANRRILFSVERYEAGQTQPAFVVTRPLLPNEVDGLVGQLQAKLPSQGGKEFLADVDAETGAVTQTRLTEEEVAPTATATKATGKRRGAKVVAEETKAPEGEVAATADTGLPPPAAAAASEEPATVAASVAAEPTPSLTERAKNAAGTAAETVKSATANVTASVKPVLRSFDKSLATKVALGTAVPAYAFYFYGYGQGKDYGQGYDTLYLESLIPAENLRVLTVDQAK